MIRAPQLERRRRQGDAHLARRWSVDAAGQARGRIKLDAFQRGVTAAGMPCEMLEGPVPEHRAAA